MSTLSLYFSVSGVQKTEQFSMRQNVKKDVNYIIYQGNVSEEDVSCAYVGSKEIDPRANIEIIKKDDELEENSPRVFSGEVKWQGNSITTASSNFLITDVFGDFVSQESVPLYWKHVLPSASINPDSVKILDHLLNEVPASTFRAIRHATYDDTTGVEVSGSYDSCAVYSNYENSYDESSGEVKIYFVKYEVSGTSHYQLLNQQEVFSEATWEDIWSVTASLKWWEKVYILSPGTEEFTVTLPRSDVEYALKLNDKGGRILVKDFLDVTDEEPWFPRISNGAFLRTDTYSGETFRYSIPEFSSQTFNPVSPYKSIVGETAIRLRGDVYKVDATPLKVDSTLYIMDVIIKDKSGNVLYAYTTDTTKNAQYYYHDGERVYRTIEKIGAWVQWDSNGIVGWDQQSGFIHLRDDLSDKYSCEVSYYFEEKYLQYTSLNVNPIFDETYNGQFYALYVVPTGGANNNTGQTASVHYVKVNRSGRIVATSQDGSSGNYDLNSVIQTDGEYIHYNYPAEGVTDTSYSSGSSTIGVTYSTTVGSFPEKGVLVIGSLDVTNSSTQIIGYSSKTTAAGVTTFTLSSNLTATLTSGTTVRLFSFVDILTPNTMTGITANTMQWFVIAEMHISTSYKPEDLSIIDTRVRGGVIKEDLWEAAAEFDPRSTWLRPQYVANKGQHVPGESVAVIKVPYTVLTDYGGTFKQSDVEDIVKKHIAVGIMPVVIYHGAIPEITSASSTSSSVTICWGSEGTDYSYYVYQSSLENGPWTKLNSTAVSDQVYGNCYTVTGLRANTVYYFSVTSLSTDGIESPRGVAWGVKTRTS